MTNLPPSCATVCSLFLAFLGAIVPVYVVNVVGFATASNGFSALLTYVMFPLLGAFVALPILAVFTLLAWACFVWGNRVIRTSRPWAGVVALALTAITGSAFYFALSLVNRTLQEPRQLLAFSLALAVIVAICLARGVGRRQEGAIATHRPNGTQ